MLQRLIDWLQGSAGGDASATIAREYELTDIDFDSCCCCSPIGMSREVVERIASLHFGSVCTIDMTETRNPHRCEDLSDHYHWLLSKGVRDSSLN